jgi:hypothetical protein
MSSQMSSSVFSFTGLRNPPDPNPEASGSEYIPEESGMEYLGRYELQGCNQAR